MQAPSSAAPACEWLPAGPDTLPLVRAAGLGQFSQFEWRLPRPWRPSSQGGQAATRADGANRRPGIGTPWAAQWTLWRAAPPGNSTPARSNLPAISSLETRLVRTASPGCCATVLRMYFCILSKVHGKEIAVNLMCNGFTQRLPRQASTI